MRWYEIRRALLLESFKPIKNKFQDQEDIDEYIDKFRKLKDRNLLPKNRSDISVWQSYTWDKFKNLIDAYWDNKILRDYFNTLEFIDIENNDDWHIVVPLNYNTSRKHGTNTNWCVASSNAKEMFTEYFYKNKETLIFFINKNTKDKWAIHYTDKSNIQYVDANNNYFDKQTFEQKSGIDSEKYIDMVINNHQDIIDDKRKIFNDIKNTLSEDLIKLSTNKRNIKIEKKLIINGNGDQFEQYVQKVYANNDTSVELPILFKKEAIDLNPRIFDILKSKRKERIENYQEKLNNSNLDLDKKQEKLQSYIYNLIKEETYSIKDILDAGIEPNEKVQLLAVSQDGWAIKDILEHVITPKENVQLAAVRQNGYLIEYILKYLKTASEEIQLAAVSQTGLAIYYILEYLKTASERVQLAAVSQNSSAISDILEYLKTASEEIQLAAVSQDVYAIKHILKYLGKASEEIQLAAVNKNGWAIKYILEYLKTETSERVQLTAVKQDGRLIEYILLYLQTKTSEKVQLAAVSQNGYLIEYILKYLKTASEKVWLTAFKDNEIWFDIDYIYRLMIRENIIMPPSIQLFIVKNKPEHFNKDIITDSRAIEYMRQNHPRKI